MGRHTLPLRNARLLRGLDRLSLHSSPLEVEGAAPQVGPRRHLLAHRRLLLAADADGATRAGLLGLDAVYLRLVVCHRRHHRQPVAAERALEPGDLLLRRHGPERARRPEAPARQRLARRLLVDRRRGRLLHHRRCVLLVEQAQIYALRLPLLRPCRQRLPHHRRLGRADAAALIAIISKLFGSLDKKQ